MNGYGMREEERLGRTIAELRDRLDEVEKRSTRIPVFNQDPVEEDPTNFWMLTDGRLRARVAGGIREWAPVTTPGSATSAMPITAPAQPQSYSTVWDATWWQTYGSDMNRRDVADLYYGKDPKFGMQYSMWGFDTEAMRDELSGASIRAVDVYMENVYTAAGNGTLAHLFGHDNVSQPEEFGGLNTSATGEIRVGNPDRPDAYWRRIPNLLGQRLATRTIHGLAIVQSDETNLSYGYARGGSPKIRVEYVK